MGDFASIVTALNLSPINTVLLGVLVWVLRQMHQRLQTLEEITVGNKTSIAFIKGTLRIKEEDDE